MALTKEEFAVLVKEHYRKSHSTCMTPEEIESVFEHPDTVYIIDGDYKHWCYKMKNDKFSEEKIRSYGVDNTAYNIELLFG